MENRLSVLLVSAAPSGGVVHHQIDLLSLLDPDRYSIAVACPRESELWQWLDVHPHIERHGVAMPRAPSPVDVAALRQLMPLVSRADVVHAHAAKAGLLCRAAARMTGRTSSCVFTPHGWSFWAFDGPRRALYLNLERRAARWCRAIVAVSNFERDAGLASGVGTPEGYRVVPNGIDVKRFGSTPQPVPGRIVMVARFASQKDHITAVHAMKMIHAAPSKAVLQFVGEGPLRGEVERLVASMGLGDRVQFLGTRRDIPELLAGASCCLMATHYEGCSLAVLEGMAAGLPVVATRVGGMSEIVSDGVTGILVDPGPEPMARALETIITDSTLARRMGRAGCLEVRRRLTREAMTAGIERIYQDIGQDPLRGTAASTRATNRSNEKEP